MRQIQQVLQQNWQHSNTGMGAGLLGYTVSKNVIREKGLQLSMHFFFWRHLFTYVTILTWGRKYFVIYLLVAKWKMPPLPPRRPFLENGRLTRANVTLFLSTQVWSRTHYRHNLPAGSLSAECVPVLPPTQKKNKHLEAWGSECKCEYIHPHAALLNLWA